MTTSETAQPLPEEIASAVSGVWQRHAAKRPTKASAEINGNVVTCRIPNAVRDFEAGPEGDDPDGADHRTASYRRQATAAVSKATHCRVVALISDRDPDSDTATETFVLETAPKLVAFGDSAWIAR